MSLNCHTNVTILESDVFSFVQSDELPDGDCFLQKRKDLENEVEDQKRSLIIKVHT